jgi:type IV pilus assembly protein PilX
MTSIALPTASARRAGQRGATLIVLLVMLVIVTLLTLSSLRTTSQEERMAGNFRDRDKAFQAAEAVVKTCMAQKKANTFTGALLAPVLATGASSAANNWDSTWSDANSTAVTIASANLAADPRCMVEDLTSGSFRVTGRAVGANADTVVILQATYSTQ